MARESPPHGIADLPPTARRIFDAAQTILSERGYAELTMAAIEQESGANRALVSYYFGGKAGLVAVLIDGLFQDPDDGGVEQIRAEREGPERTERFLDWQRGVSADPVTLH